MKNHRPLRKTDAPRILLYSHDGLGLGHFRRTLNIGEALLQHLPDAGILLDLRANTGGLVGSGTSVTVKAGSSAKAMTSGKDRRFRYLENAGPA